MEMEGLTPQKPFLSEKMLKLVSDTDISLTFLYANRTAQDQSARKCAKCGATLKPHDPVTKLRVCNHLYHTDCYVKHMAVSRCSNLPRQAISVICVLSQPTMEAWMHLASRNSWKTLLSPREKKLHCI